MILVKTFFAYNDLRNYSYVILDDKSGDSWVIDPYEAGPIIDYIRKSGMNLKGILNTHQHHDHIRGNAVLSDAFHAPVTKLKDSESIALNEKYILETIDTPGHTMDHQVFLWKEADRPLALFSGDTLFNAGVGNCRNGGDVNALFTTTADLLKLPDDTILYPGHDYRKKNLEFALSVEPENKTIQEKLKALSGHPTEELEAVTLGEEKKVNPFFRLDSDEIRQNVMKTDTTKKELFVQLRSLRDRW